MQTAETFEQLLKVMSVIDKIDSRIMKLLDQLKGFKESRKIGLKLVESIKQRITWIYEDIRLVFLSNLDALARDGRMSLK